MMMFQGHLAPHKRIIGFFAVLVAAFAAVAIIGLLLSMLGTFTIGGLPHLTWSFLTEAPRNSNMEGGIFPAIIGTALLVLIMTILGVPVGTATAIYLNEYAKQSSVFARSVRFAVNTLAGVPSIVFGLFGVGFFVQFLGKGVDGAVYGDANAKVFGEESLIWCSATLAVLTLPVVIVAVEEALRAVPRELREASLALGATRWQTIRTIVLPNSISGILTGVILVVARAAGETAPIMLTGAVASMWVEDSGWAKFTPYRLDEQFMAMAMHLNSIARDVPGMPVHMKCGSALVLLLLILTINSAAVLLRLRLRRGKRW